MIADILHADQVTLENATSRDLDIIRQKIVEKMDASWHLANLINDSETGHITVFLPVTSVKDWSERLAALDEIAVIQSYDIISLYTGGGQVSLRLVGSQGALQNALAAHRLQLVDEGDRHLINVRRDDD